MNGQTPTSLDSNRDTETHYSLFILDSLPVKFELDFGVIWVIVCFVFFVFSFFLNNVYFSKPHDRSI